MIDSNKHKFFLFQILKDIYENKELAGKLGFKGDTALMFFYDLPRFSVIREEGTQRTQRIMG